jgi:hypothetical protein
MKGTKKNNKEVEELKKNNKNDVDLDACTVVGALGVLRAFVVNPLGGAGGLAVVRGGSRVCSVGSVALW